MFVRQWMTTNPKTVTPDTSLADAYKKMKDFNVRRFPVIDDEKRVVGVITEGDCLKASPSPASTLSKYELNYLLDQIKVKDIMNKQVISVSPDILVEEAALVLRREKIGGVPVVENDRLVGVITETDIFDAFIDIMGMGQPGTRLLLELEDHHGVLADVTQIISRHIGNITSVAEFHRNETGRVYLMIRFTASDEEQKAIINELESHGHKVRSIHQV
ncbi:CBS and ACT domain-containing protein [Microaerobacter geothermalis]|uniref:CBS and ACT domain-containing protein n=1 Tax=Microaerobacter geothermalis TaxID=674972 RepID=UPI001F2F8664|nr:CBS and ACT domain-containing protein [Microaerobacter geothermalis]MCF6095031.1 CBS and ACT domain-containing protein [Microaerobacter geothermalis]